VDESERGLLTDKMDLVRRELKTLGRERERERERERQRERCKRHN